SRICSSSLARHPRSTLLPYTTLFRSDAGGAAGDQHTFAADGALQTARQRKIRIEMALPVVPEPPSVVLQSRQTDARRLEQCARLDRKSTRLNSSHVKISYAVFCLKKK